MKERVNLIKKGFMKVSLEGGNQLLPMVRMDDKFFLETVQSLEGDSRHKTPWEEYGLSFDEG